MEYAVITLGILTLILSGILIYTRQRMVGSGLEQSLRSEFQVMSQQTLTTVSEQFLLLAEERISRLATGGTQELEGKKELIDQQLQAMKLELTKVSTLVQNIEKDREAKFAQLGTQLKTIGEQASLLTVSTATLREALASSRARGQWGERMAEDILRHVGFVEGINYQKQQQIAGGSSIPDFVFFLPKNLKLNMDVKFPLDNYLRSLEGGSETERTIHRNAFLRDVRGRITELSGREYINPEQGTLDYVLMFIPNESVYSFMHEQDPDLLEFGLRSKVVCCAPLTLFAILALVRQATDNFALQQASEEVVSLFGRFKVEWDKFTKAIDTLGNRLTSTQKAFDSLRGTRKRALERPLEKIEELRNLRGIPSAIIEGSLSEMDELDEQLDEEDDELEEAP